MQATCKHTGVGKPTGYSINDDVSGLIAAWSGYCSVH